MNLSRRTISIGVATCRSLDRLPTVTRRCARGTRSYSPPTQTAAAQLAAEALNAWCGGSCVRVKAVTRYVRDVSDEG
jgi:hypothetical protein